MKRTYKGCSKKLKNTEPERYAIIDLGSNTIRLSVYTFEAETISVIFTKKEIGGLAGMVSKQKLTEQGIQRACEILAGLKETALAYTPIANVHLFATASLRNINNQSEVVRRIEEATKLTPRVLPGEEEGRLAFLGASHYLPCRNGLMMDIGGGSTELVLVKNSDVQAVASLPIGCLNLYANFVKNMSPNPAERKKIEEAIKVQLRTLTLEQWGDEPIPLMIGAGGTMRALAKLSYELYEGQTSVESMDTSQVKDIYRRIKKDPAFYHVLYNTIPDRVITIVPGLMIARQVIKRFKCEKVMISKFGVREGYLMSRVIGRNEA